MVINGDLLFLFRYFFAFMRFLVFEVLFQEDISLLPRNFYCLFMNVVSGNPEMLSKSRQLFLSISDVLGQGKLNASGFLLQSWFIRMSFNGGGFAIQAGPSGGGSMM